MVDSRKRMVELLRGYPANGVLQISAKDVDYGTFADYFVSFSMFDEKQIIVVEGKLDAKEVDWEVVGGGQSSADLLIWVDQTVKSNEVLYKKIVELNGVIEFFEEAPDKDIFGFLDAVVARNRVNALKEYRKLLAQDKDLIYIHTMLVWQFRHLLVPEMGKGFVVQKAQRGRENFTEDELFRIYRMLYEMEVALKTGVEMPEMLIEQLVMKVTKGNTVVSI